MKTTESGGSRGYDAGTKIKGRKRHVLVDSDGRALLVEPHTADVQNRDGGAALLQVSRTLFPFSSRPCCERPPNEQSLALWDLIGRLVDLFQPTECANYFSSCGYDPD